MRKISQSQGRISLKMEGFAVGKDYTIILTGGKTHIGAIALAAPGICASTLQIDGHREGKLAEKLAAIFAARLQCSVAVICGIHYDDITREEICQIEQMALAMAEKWPERKEKC